MDQVKNEMSAVQFDGEDFSTPIVYGFMYIQWEANKVSHHVIAFVKLLAFA